MGMTEAKARRMLEHYDLTVFQKKVLTATAGIKKGKVLTYKQLAGKIGMPNSYRAVGNALGKNPLAPAIPCHRVVRSDGEIGGYSAPGGTGKKTHMLRREKTT